MKTFKLVLLGLITFIITAIWLTPTAFIAPYVQRAVPGLQLNGGSGTIWSGAAARVTYQQYDFGRVKWTLKPLTSLTSLSAVADVDMKSDWLEARGEMGYGYDRSIHVKDTRFELEAAALSQFQRSAQMGGEFNGLITEAALSPGAFPFLEGTVNWTQGSLNSPIRLEPGNYRALVSSTDNELKADLSSNDAPLELSGNVKLGDDWRYQSDVLVKPRPGSSPLLGSLLRTAAGGNPNPDGSLRINRQGAMQPIQLY